ncbi:hypothetical protein MGAD_09950 [Mycolicibacterium gadium]|uniref:Uncharacterized protein n=1 Tax=Mycolicibacterium gadium TaxID=1794 RepID=A0A7I7WHV7_MYCGU|nr:hypothetical protein MGAD_09950 [Mycolicibacterium gadium]
MWYSAASAVSPASIQAMTSATGAPGSGGLTGAVVVVVVVDDGLLVLGGIGVIRSAPPSVEDEHPATSIKIAISPVSRIPARLAGRLADTVQARRRTAFANVG